MHENAKEVAKQKLRFYPTYEVVEELQIQLKMVMCKRCMPRLGSIVYDHLPRTTIKGQEANSMNQIC